MKIPANIILVVMLSAGIGLFAQGTATAPTTAPAPAAAPAPDAPKPWTMGSIRITGLIDGYYSKNFNNPASGNNVLRNFDVKSNSLTLNMTKISLTHDADPVGFTLDLGFGRAWDVFHATEPSGSGIVNYIPQAFVSFKPQNAGGLQIDFGKFYTSAGAELTENNLTWSYSRGYLYANGPYYHAGLRVTKPLTKSFSAGVQLVNGWNNVEDNNSGKTLGFTTAWTGSKISWFNSYYTGPEKKGTNQGFRNFYDRNFHDCGCFTDYLFCLSEHGAYYQRCIVFNDACLFFGNCGNIFSKKFLMVQGYVGNHTEQGKYHIGAIQPSTHTHLYDGNIHFFLIKIFHGHGKGEFKE